MANNDKISKVYDALVKSGYNMAPEDVFRQRMNDPAKRRAAYDALRKSGYNMRPYDEFEVNIGYGKAGSSAPATPASTPTSAASATTKAATAQASPTDAPEQPDSSAPQGGWQPTAKEKAAISFRLHTLTNDFNERSRERVEQTRRMSEGFSPEGREKQRAARTRAQIAGTPMQVAGVTPDVQAESNEQTLSGAAPVRTGAIGRIAHAADETARRMTDGVKGKKSGQSPLPYGVVIENGERKTQWLLPDGSLTTDIVEADRAEYGARRVRLMHQFVGRMKENGLNPAKLEDVQKQAQLDYEAPMRKVLNSVWAQAEEEDRAADEEYRREMEEYNKTVRSNVRAFGPDGMPLTTSEENPRDFNRAVKRKETFNLESMANTILNNLPASYRLQSLHAYHQYFTAHTDELNGRSVHQAAVDALRSEVYNAVYQRAVDSRMPKSKMEFLIRKIADQPLISPYQAMEMGASSMANSWGMNLAELDAMGQYGSQHRALDITGSVFNMAIDPLAVASGGAGGVARNMFSRAAGRIMAKGMAKGTAKRFMTSRPVASRLLYGIAGHMVQGGANFAVYEMGKDAERQMYQGGYVNPETGQLEGFSMSSVLNSGVHGFIMGAATGPIAPIFGNVGTWLTKKVPNTAAKMGVRTGEMITSKVFEGTIFASHDIYHFQTMNDAEFDKKYARQFGYDTITDETKRAEARKSARNSLSWDAWYDSEAMMVGFGVSHMVKTAPSYIRSLRPIKPRVDASGREIPLTQEERAHNRMSFEERLRNRLDMAYGAVPMTDSNGRPNGLYRDMQLTKEEREELRRAGYGKLADLFTRREKGKGATPDVKPEDGAIDFPIAEAQEVGKRPEFDGYDAMERLVQDSKVSQAVRAKAYYILTGRMLPMGSIMAYTTQQSEDGRFIVNSVTADGEVVTSRVFANEAKAQNEINNIKRQAELNTIDVGERYAEQAINLVVMDEVKDIVAARHKLPAEAVENIYMKHFKGEKLSDAEMEIVNDVNSFSEQVSQNYRSLSPEAMREAIEEQYGVNVDEALRKTEQGRSATENEAVKEYASMLYQQAERQRKANSIFNAQYNEMRAEHKENLRRAWKMQMEGKLLGFDPEVQAEADRAYEESHRVYDRFEQGDPTAQADIDAIGLRMQEAYQMCEDAFGAEAEYYMFRVNENPWALVNDPELTAEQQDAVLYYINSKAALDGVMDASHEASQRKREQVEQEVAGRTHKERGVIIPAVLKVDDKPAYIIKGDVAMYPDGSGVDVTKSSESIIIMDESGEYKFVSPDQIYKVGESIDPQDELQTAYNQIDAEQQSVFGVDVPPEPEAPSQPIVDTSEYDRGYERGIEVSASLADDVLNDAITDLRGRERLTDAGRGMLEAYEYEQQRRAMEASGEETSAATLSEGKNDVTSQHGNRPEQNNDGLSAADHGGAVAGDAARGVETDRDRSDIRVYEEGLGTSHDEYPEHSERNRRETESERLVKIARENGQYKSRSEVASLGKRYPKNTGESEVIIDYEHGRVYKIKDPYAKAAMKPGVNPEDAILEHLVHNKYFPETAYRFEGISDDLGDARIILSQGYVESVGQATPEQIEAALAEKGLTRIDRYHYGNDEVVVTDVTGDNALVGADGKVYFIDPIINFKRPVREIVGEMPEKEENAVSNAESVPNSDIPVENGQERADVGISYGKENWEESLPERKKAKVEDDEVNRLIDKARNGDAESLEKLSAYGILVGEGGVYRYISEGEYRDLTSGKHYRGRFGDGKVDVTSSKSVTTAAKAGYRVVFNEGFDLYKKDGRSQLKNEGLGDGWIMDGYDIRDVARIERLDERGNVTEVVYEKNAEARQERTPLERIPRDEKGEPVFEQAESPEVGWDALVEYSKGNPAKAQRIADIMVENKRKDYEKAQKLKPKGRTVSEILKSDEDNAAQLAQAESEYNLWQRIARVEQARKNAIRAEQEAEARRLAAERTEEEFRSRASGARTNSTGQWSERAEAERAERAAREEAERLEREALEGVRGAGRTSKKFDRSVPKTPEAQRSAITRILEIARKVKNRVERAVIGSITKRQAQDYADNGIEVDETWVHSFETSAVVHNQKHHGNEAIEASRGQIAITEEDYTLIPDILENYDKVSKSPNKTKGTENEVIIYEKEFGDGYVYYLEEKRDNRKSLAFHTMYKKKKGTDSSDGFAVEPTAPITPLATPDNLSSNSERKVTDSASEKQEKDSESSVQSSDNKGRQTVQSAVEAASAQVNTTPTPAQAEAGNYKKGHVTIGEFDITIENPAGSERKKVDADGKEWSTTMANTYGYIKGTEGVDGDHIDVFLHQNMDEWNGRKVYVVDQTNPDGSFDEHKVMLGFNDKDEAMAAYLANYDKSWGETHPGLHISETDIEEFDKWVQSSHRKTKPFADYKNIRALIHDVDQTPTNVNEGGMVVDVEGKALTLYHGTPNDVELSDLEMGHTRAGGDEAARYNGDGISFTPNRDVAEDYASDNGGQGKVFEVNVTLKKPYFTLGVANLSPEEAAKFTATLQAQGYDGIINYQSKAMREAGAIPNEVIVFDIKSATPVKGVDEASVKGEPEKPGKREKREKPWYGTESEMPATPGLKPRQRSAMFEASVEAFRDGQMAHNHLDVFGRSEEEFELPYNEFVSRYKEIVTEGTATATEKYLPEVFEYLKNRFNTALDKAEAPASEEVERDKYGNPLDDWLDPIVGNGYVDEATGKQMYETKKAKTFGEFMLGLHSEYNNDAFTGRDKALAFAKRSDSKQGERWSKNDEAIHEESVVYPISGFDVPNMERWTQQLGKDTFSIIDDEAGAYYEVQYIRPKSTSDPYKVRVVKASFNAPAPEKQADTSDTYTITPTTYTNKKGRTRDVWLVKFNRELTAEEKAAFDTFMRGQLTEGKKTSRGWYDRKQEGYMMRSEEAARQLGEMLGNEEAVADAQPLSREDIRNIVDSNYMSSWTEDEQDLPIAERSGFDEIAKRPTSEQLAEIANEYGDNLWEIYDYADEHEGKNEGDYIDSPYTFEDYNKMKSQTATYREILASHAPEMLANIDERQAVKEELGWESAYEYYEILKKEGKDAAEKFKASLKARWEAEEEAERAEKARQEDARKAELSAFRDEVGAMDNRTLGNYVRRQEKKAYSQSELEKLRIAKAEQARRKADSTKKKKKPAPKPANTVTVEDIADESFNDDEVVDALVNHPMFKNMVDNNPDIDAAREMVKKVMDTLRTSYRRDDAFGEKGVNTYLRLTRDPELQKRLEDVAFAKRKPYSPAEPKSEPAPKGQFKVTDEMKAQEEELRRLLGIDDDEGSTDSYFRDPEELTPEQMRKVFSLGVNYAFNFLDNGVTTFPDFAKAIVGRLGTKVKPFIKSWYEGAKRVPGYGGEGYTDTAEVDRFDIENFDKPSPDAIRDAEMRVAERKAKQAAEQAEKELIAERNEQRKKDEQQTAADTAALASEAEAVASEGEATADSAKDERAIAEASEKVDNALDKISKQLAILGYFERKGNDPVANVERKAAEAGADLAARLTDELGLKLTDLPKGVNVASADFGEMGGYVRINLPVRSGYEPLRIDIRFARTGNESLRLTELTSTLKRGDEKSYIIGEDHKVWLYAPKYGELLETIKEQIGKYLPKEEFRSQASDARTNSTGQWSEQGVRASHNGYKRGDEVMWDRYGNGKWEKVKIEDFDTDGSPIFESFKGVMSEKGDWSRVKPADGVFGEAKRVATKAKAERKRIEKPEAKGWDLNPTSILSTTGDGTKIQISKQTAKANLHFVSLDFTGIKNTKGFIAALSKALGTPEGTHAQSFYYDVTTDSGKAFTLRLSNHNVNSANHVGKTPEISIVVKSRRQPNRFFPSEEAEVTEYVYFKEDIAVGDGNTLSWIAKDISDMLDSGHYADSSGMAVVNRSPVTPGKKPSSSYTEASTDKAAEVMTGGRVKKSRKKDVTLKADEPVGGLFANLFDEPETPKANEKRNGNKPSQEVAGGERAHTVGTDETGTDGRVPAAGTEPTDKGGTADETSAGVERGTDGTSHGTDADGGLQPLLGDRGRDESNADSRSAGASVERGGTSGAGSVSRRGTDRGAEGLSEGEPASESGRRSGTASVKKPKKPEVRYTRNFRYDEKAGNEADSYTPKQRLEANVKAIETLADVLFGGKPATEEQRAIMSRFRGWGQVDLGKYYDIDHILRNTYSDTPINRLAKVIQKLDPQGDKKLFDAIKRASLSSYYTPIPIARAMNTFLGLAGYKGGALLDPSMGNGMYEGTLPKSIQERTAITGVELDWISGQLSRKLYPDANVMIGGFEKSGIAPGSFDVVTSNVPFGDIVVNDPTWKNDATPLKRSAQNRIHNYYAVKMLEAARPGGLVAMLTTSAVMDTPSNQNIRAHIADQGEILGAIRLPDNTFQGTGVVTDILLIRKWRDDQDRAQAREDASYIELENAFLSHYEATAPNKLDGKEEKVRLNGYFEKNPRNLIGEMQAGNQYGKRDAFGLTSKLSVEEIASEIEKAVRRIVGTRRGSLFNPSRTIRESQQAIREAYKGDGDWVSNGNLVIQDGKVGVLTAKSNEYGEVTREFEGTLKHDKMLPKIKAMTGLRTAMKKLIAGQIEGSDEANLTTLRGELQEAYDQFVGKYGRLQDKDNAFILDDIDGYTLQALETWKNGKFTGLSDIFTKNSIKPALKLDGKKTPQEAVALSLAEYGYLRPDYLAKALGEDWAEQCGDFVFLKPNSEDDYVTRDEYLSGDVVTKLAEAKAAAEKEEAFKRNVKALEEVQPARIPFDDIAIHLGARWIPENVLNDFVNNIFGIHAVRSNRNGHWDPEKKEYVYNQKSGVRYIPETDSFEINIEKKELGGAASDWETPKKSAKEILQAALEDKTLLIKYKDKEGNEHIDEEQTELANQKIADLRERFESWLPSDPERVDLLEQTYNDRFNRTVIRHFDGTHLVVPGLMGKELRPHQKDAVWMLINNRGGIVDHIVGAGKTLVMQSAIMEMRRMGIAKKPMIVALKSTVAQIAREFKEAFPSARVLAPNDSDFKKGNRKKFIANISLNDYDCVILSHEQYCMLPHTKEAERAVIDEQMWQLDNMIEYLYGTNDSSQMTQKQIKALEKRRENLKARLEKRLDRNVDREFCFENLGIDYMFVDESHQFKSLPYVTSYQKVAGLGDAKGSSRAVALLTGIRHLQRMHQGDKGTVFLSGTTITNSLVEIYNLLNYLRPRKLEELGMPTFDAWASVFAVHSAELEAGVTGNFAMKDRFRSFDNVPELSQLYAEIADVRNDTNLKLPKPVVDGRTVIVPASESMQEINSEIVNMLESKNGSYFDIYPKDPNRAPWGFHASTLSAKAAVSPRLIFPDMEDDGGKVHAVCENVKKYYDEQADQLGVQLIFCEIGVPDKSKRYDAYTDMMNRFVNDYGIPRSEIAYIQEANTEEKRKDLFQRVRDGKVRILIGGTKNMGTGVNVQDRITDMHMLTVPWTPSALEQCIGRGARQGNLVARDFMDNKVRVHYYATEGSLDLYKYQLLDAKGKMFTQFKMGTVNGGRSFDEGSADEDGNIDPAEMVAILSGNPVIFERAKQEKVVKKLRALRNGFERDYQRKKAKHAELQRRKENFVRLIRLNDRDRADLEREGFKPDDKGIYPTTVTITEGYSRYGGRTFDKPKEAGEYLLKMLEEGKNVTLQGFGQRAQVVTVNEEGSGGLFSTRRELQIGTGEHDIKYTIRLSDDATAAGTAFRNLLKRIVDNGAVYRHELEAAQNQLAGMNIGDGVFPRQAELDEAVAKLKELNAEYNKLGKTSDSEEGDKSMLRDGDDMTDGERLLAIHSLKPIEVERNELSKAELFAEYRGLPDVEKDGDIVQFLRTAFGKNYKEGGLFAQVVPQLDNLLETSVLAYSEKDSLGGTHRPDGTEHKAHPNVIRFDNYVNKALVGGKEYYVRMTVQKTRDNTTGLHSCFVSNVDVYEKPAKEGTDSAILRRPNDFYDGIVDAKLQQFFERASSELRENEMVERVKGMSERMNTPVRILRTPEEIEAYARNPREAKAKGISRIEHGGSRVEEIAILLPNNTDLADVENTFLHEGMGHDGLRLLFPTEKLLNNALDELYNASNDAIKADIDARAKRMYDAEVDRIFREKQSARESVADANSKYYTDMAEAHAEANAKREQMKRDATEEYGANVAGKVGEKGFEKMTAEEQTFWGKMKALLQQAFENLLRGLKIPKMRKWTDKQWAYIYHKAYKMKKAKGKMSVIEEAEDIVMRRRTGWDDAMLSESAKVEDANNRFNRELQQQIDGTLPNGHIYQLGNPGTILRSTGVPNLPIQMSAARLRVKATEYGHDFDLAEIRNLVKELQTPMAVFAYGNKGKMQNIIVGIESNGKQFIVGLSLNPIVNGKALEINSVRNVFPKNNAEWLNWISQGKLLYADKQKIQALIDKQRTILADVAYLDLEDVAKVIKTFENPRFDGDEDVRFRDGADYVERVPVMARAMYEKQIQSSMYQFTEAMQDSMRGLMEFYKAVESQGAKRDIADVASFENAYIAENLMSSKSHAEMEEYEHRIMRPLLDIAARMSVNKRGRQELIDYMMAKHGLERNAYMRNEAIANGEESERDFAGLCGLTGEQDWQDAETAARQIVDDYETAHSADIAELWSAVNKATKTSLQKVYNCGLISKEQYEKIRDMYDYYIPLRGFDEKTSDDVYGYLTSKSGGYSSPIKKAEGRESKADDPLATIAYMAQNSIIQGNRNVMKQKFLTYVQNHPSDLASVNRLWLVYDETADAWKPVFADVDENMTPDEIDKAVIDFEQRMESLSQSEPDKYKRGRDAIGIPYRMVDGNIKEHQVVVKRNGESFVITINGNPRAAQAVNGLTNPDNDLNGAIGKVFNMAGIVNRQLSQFYTTRNPDFVVSNFIRDLIYSNTMVHVKENQGYAMKFHKNHAKVNPVRIVRLLHLYDTNQLNMRNPIHRMFYEFMHWGGETGYTMQRDLDQEKKLVARLMNEARRGKLNPISILNLIGNNLDRVNRAVENSARFAAFVTSRESGRDVQRSVYDAKEISVNFNKKGAGSKFMDVKGQTVVGNTAGFISGLGRSFYVFWNAAVQGTANYAKAFKKHPGKAIMSTTALVLLGYVMTALVDDDDDENKNSYYNVPKYTRRSNLMFRSGEQWVTIPLPVEYRALYGLGELAYSVTSGREEYSDAELAKETASQLSQLMPLDFMEGGGGLHAFVPSAFKPLVESATNRSWTGLPIYKDTPFNKDMPEWTKAYPRTNAQLIDLSKWANEASGGNDYKAGWANFNPAQLEYLLNGYFGGYSNVINKMVKTGETMFGDRAYDPSSILLVNRLVKMGDERTAEKKVNSDFFKYLEEYRRTHTLLRKYEEEADRGSDKYRIFLDALRQSRDGARHDVIDEYITDYNRLNRAIKDPECSEEERESYETDMRRLKREVVSLMKVAHDSLQVNRLREKFVQEYEQQ